MSLSDPTPENLRSCVAVMMVTRVEAGDVFVSHPEVIMAAAADRIQELEAQLAEVQGKYDRLYAQAQEFIYNEDNPLPDAKEEG